MKISQPEFQAVPLALRSSALTHLPPGTSVVEWHSPSSRVTPYLMSQLISSINTSCPFLPEESHTFHCSPTSLPDHIPIFFTIWISLVLVLLSGPTILNHMTKNQTEKQQRNRYHNRVLPVWTGTGLVLKNGSSFVFGRRSIFVFVQMTSKYISSVCLRLGAAPHSSNKSNYLFSKSENKTFKMLLLWEILHRQNMWKYVKLPTQTYTSTLLSRSRSFSLKISRTGGYISNFLFASQF